jgi:RNA polymerase sigma factor (sigma-70 family)
MADGDLLDRYIRQGDEAAFALIVERHGPMVLGVCRRLLANHADAEDAFQATFLVLVRKAVSIVPRGHVGNWLYGVACNAARKAKAMKTRRHAKEQQAADARPTAQCREDRDDVHRVLHEELARLPASYRAAIVGCDLEGRTLREAAQHLGWPQGTVAGRLARGRALLARRLTKRGVTLSAGLLAGALAGTSASASLPASLADSILRAATAYAADPAAIAPRVAPLVQGVLEAMLIKKCKSALVVLVLVALTAAGLNSFAGSPAASDPGGEARPAKKQDAPGAPWRVRLTFAGHKDRVYGVAYSRDGTLLATASRDGTAALWNATTGKKLLTLDGHEGEVHAVAISPDRKRIATAGKDCTVRLWDASTGKEMHRMQHKDPVQALVFAPGGKILIASGGVYDSSTDEGRGELRRWDVETGRELIPFTNEFPRGIDALHISVDGNLLVTASGKTVTTWDWDGKDGLKERHSASAEESAFAYGLALSPDARTLAITWDAKVHLYDTATGKLRCTLEKSYVGVWDSLTFTPDGKTLAANITRQVKEGEWIAQRGSMVRVWDVATGKVQGTHVLAETICAMAFAPDGKTLAIGCRGGVRFPDGEFIDLRRLEEETDGSVKLVTIP